MCLEPLTAVCGQSLSSLALWLCVYSVYNPVVMTITVVCVCTDIDAKCSVLR